MKNTELTYLEDSYMKKMESRILKNKEYVVLDKTIFYPEGGGQPSDTGTINGVKVIKARKKGSEVRHYTEKPLEETEQAKLEIDWKPRYARMRMHTAQHLLSAIVLDDYKATTAGNQIHEDHSRIDFKPFTPGDEVIENIVQKFNEYVEQGIPVNNYITIREKVMEDIDPLRRNLFNRVPAFVKDIRVIEIEGIDKCPCAGTHVQNTKEIGKLKIIKRISKGKDTTRIEYRLE